MKNILVICIVIFLCLCVGGCLKNDEMDINIEHEQVVENLMRERYNEAMNTGGNILKEEYPELINNDSDFIGYEINGIWHVQNYIECNKYNPSVYTSNGKRFGDIEKIRYVKFSDKNFDKILMFGEFEILDSNIDARYEIEDFDSTFHILKQIIADKYAFDIGTDYIKSMAGETWQIIIPGYMINVRNKDGMILYFGEG